MNVSIYTPAQATMGLPTDKDPREPEVAESIFRSVMSNFGPLDIRARGSMVGTLIRVEREGQEPVFIEIIEVERDEPWYKVLP